MKSSKESLVRGECSQCASHQLIKPGKCRTMQTVPEGEKWCFINLDQAIKVEEQILDYVSTSSLTGRNICKLKKEVGDVIKKLQAKKEYLKHCNL